MLILMIAAVVTIAVDQAAKQVVIHRLREGEVTAHHSGIRLRRITNATLPSGFRNCRQSILVWALTLLSIVFLVTKGPLFQSYLSHAGLGLAIGGATANLVDRLWWDGVIDFIDVEFWPVFNVADLAIVAGLALAVWSIR